MEEKTLVLSLHCGVDLSPNKFPTVAFSALGALTKDRHGDGEKVQVNMALLFISVYNNGEFEDFYNELKLDLHPKNAEDIVSKYERERIPIRKGQLLGCFIANYLLHVYNQILPKNVDRVALAVVVGVEDVVKLAVDDVKYGSNVWVKDKNRWYSFVSGLKEVIECELGDGQVVEVSPRYTSLNCPACNPPTSKEITNPTFRSGKERERAAIANGLGPRGFVCPRCGFKSDKDTVAALNILEMSATNNGLSVTNDPTPFCEVLKP